MSEISASQPDCPFCLGNNLLDGQVLYESDNVFLIEASTNPGNYLIIPKTHIESPLQLPDDWWKHAKAALAHIPDLAAEYNIAMNLGEHAGQSIRHLHFWVIRRAAGERASGKGLARLMREVNGAGK